jgi:ABC-2 type transport system permease protein
MTPFPVTVRSEWTKLVALRSTKIQLALAVLLGVGMSALLAWILGMTYDDWDASGRRDFEPIGASMIGGILSTIFLLVIGVKAATGEYASGMIRLTLTASPRRGRVLGAKAIVVAAVMTVVGILLTGAMFLVSQAIFASYGMRSASLLDGDALRAVAAVAVLSAQFPVIALALGFLLRSTAGAIIGVFALILAPPFAGDLLPAWYADHVAMYMPGAASDAIAIGHLAGATEPMLSPVAGAIVVAAWIAVFLGAAWAVFERRDA